MKKYLIILVLIFASMVAKSQINDSILVVKSIQLADSVQLIENIEHRAIIIADTSNHYWITLGDYALMIHEAYFQLWNADYQKISIRIQDGKLMDIELPAIEQKTIIKPYQQ